MCEIPGELHFHEKFQAKQKVEIELELEYGGSLSITHHNFRCYCSRYYQRTQCLKISKKGLILKIEEFATFWAIFKHCPHTLSQEIAAILQIMLEHTGCPNKF